MRRSAPCPINTASTIFNRRPNSWASKETADRVFKAAEELGYEPSRSAVALRMGKFITVGLIVPDLQNSFYATVAKTLEAAIAPRDYDLILESSHADMRSDAEHLRSINNCQVDGLVCILIDHERNHATLQG